MALPEIDGESSDDIRASLSAAFDEAEKPTEIITPDPKQETVENPETIEEAPEGETEEQKAGRLAGRKRDEHGRLLPGKADKVEAKAPKESTTKVEDKQPSDDDKAKASEAQSITADAPPAGWTPEAKAEWSKLSPAIKAGVIKRESEIINGQQRWSEEKRRYESVLSPIAQAAQRRGLNVEQGVQTLIAAQNALDADPVEGIKRIAQTYGVNLATIAGSASADSSQVNTPDITELVRQAVAPMLAPIQQRYAAEEQYKIQNTESIVSDFASKNEHFNSVQSEIMAMIPLIKESNPTWTNQEILQNAYDRAVWANPHTRAAIQASINADADAKRRAEQQAKVNKARTASTSLTGSSVIGNGADQPQTSLRAELEAAFATAG